MYFNVICNARLRQSQQYNVGQCIHFTRIDKLLIEEPFIQVYDVIIKVQTRKNVQNISILISNHSCKHVKLLRNVTLGHIKIKDSLETINMTIRKLVEKEITHIV